MANVIDLDARRPHYAGLCSCLSCRHEWVGVAPLGTKVLECPSCRRGTGVAFSAREARLVQALEQIATGTSGTPATDAAVMRDVAMRTLAAEKYGDYE